ncbi:unnamed protein product [Prorocentrum cordatum]|uniref:Uncharacterized protein n=1 Tax=Prorocentrum cordatum TaxID=2364126 RepID=A0ABN9XR68_9DINO|nr:unnamed protein product [Polarella glacialis]
MPCSRGVHVAAPPARLKAIGTASSNRAYFERSLLLDLSGLCCRTVEVAQDSATCAVSEANVRSATRGSSREPPRKFVASSLVRPTFFLRAAQMAVSPDRWSTPGSTVPGHCGNQQASKKVA